MDNCEIPRWQIIKQSLHNLSYEEFVDQSKADNTAVRLDVRTPEEFNYNSLPGAINLNYLSTRLADELEMLAKDKNYYVYCRTGRRSLRVCILLKNIGYQVFNLDNGLISKTEIEN